MRAGPRNYIFTTRASHGSGSSPVDYNVYIMESLCKPPLKRFQLLVLRSNLTRILIAKHPQGIDIYAAEAVSPVMSRLERVRLTPADWIKTHKERCTLIVEFLGNTNVFKISVK